MNCERTVPCGTETIFSHCPAVEEYNGIGVFVGDMFQLMEKVNCLIGKGKYCATYKKQTS